MPWIVLAAPLSEEVFFRVYMFRFLSQRVGVLTGILVSSASFALIHLNLSGFFVYLAVGGVFALIYRRTSNIWAPISAHVTYNGILMILTSVLGVDG